MASQIRQLKGVSDVLIPQDVDYPALELDVDREKASQLGLSQKEVVDNVITALTSNGMIAPNYWIDPKSGNPYLLTVQYPEETVQTLTDLKQIPLRGRNFAADVSGPVVTGGNDHVTDGSGPLPVVRVMDVYVAPQNRRSGEAIKAGREESSQETNLPEGARVNAARFGAGNARFVPEFWHRTDPLHRAGVPGAGGAIRVVDGSVHYFAGGAAGTGGSAAVSAGDGDHAERDVADGRGDDGWDRGVEQHFDRGVRAAFASRRESR